jgi:hypothetical protein
LTIINVGAIMSDVNNRIKTVLSAGAVSFGNRESGENPERYGHCNQVVKLNKPLHENV